MIQVVPIYTWLMTDKITTELLSEMSGNLNLLFRLLTEMRKDMVTKSDFEEVKSDLEQVKTELGIVGTDVKVIKLTLSDNGLEPKGHRQLFKHRPA